MKVYVAGKITGLDREEVIAKFESARDTLSDYGHDVIIPTVLPTLESLSHEDYLHICYAMIDVCDAVVLLPDWECSTGAKLELEYAREKGKIIYFEY